MESRTRIRLLLGDDHTVVRDGFAAILGCQPDMEVVVAVGNGREAIESFRALRPDVALLDLRMPVLGGVQAIEEIRREFPSARIIVLTTYDGDEDVYRALQAGAAGYLLKDTTTEALLRAIRSVAAGQRYVPPEIAARLVERTMAGPGLTAREVEVLGALATGKTNKEIAAEFFITEGTVKSHVNNILDKLGVRDRTEAVMEALRRGILHL
ncbi:MAG: response regulator [Isosphaeraceae bacterium]